MRVLFWLMSTALLAQGCDSAREALAERQVTLSARDAVQRYAAAVPPTLPLQETWLRELRAVSSLTDADAISAQMLQKVGPALGAYVAAIDAIAVEPALEAPHRALVAAHRDLSGALSTFATGLERRAYVARRASLSVAMVAFDKAQLGYDEAMKERYASVGLVYTPPPPVVW